MAQTREEMMGWILGEVTKTGNEGISIQELFNQLAEKYGGDGEVNEALWQSILASEDVEAGEDKVRQALKSLSLEDLSILGLGVKKIKVRPGLIVEDPVPVAASRIKAHATQTFTADYSTSEAIVLALPKKRRGRPPKEDKIEAGNQTTIQLPGLSVPKRKIGRPRKSVTPSLQENPVNPDGGVEISTKRATRPKKPVNYSLLQESSDITLDNAEAQIKSAKRGRSVASARPQSPIDEALEEIESLLSVPSPERDLSVRLQSTNGTPITKLPHEQQNGDSNTSKRPRRPQIAPLAQFTPWEGVQRADGIQGVYVDEEASRQRRINNPYYGMKSTVLVFKSDKLKDKKWLIDHKNSWFEPLATKIAAAVIHTEDTVQPPPKRKWVSKKKKVAPEEVAITEKAVEDENVALNDSTEIFETSAKAIENGVNETNDQPVLELVNFEDIVEIYQEVIPEKGIGIMEKTNENTTTSVGIKSNPSSKQQIVECPETPATDTQGSTPNPTPTNRKANENAVPPSIEPPVASHGGRTRTEIIEPGLDPEPCVSSQKKRRQQKQKQYGSIHDPAVSFPPSSLTQDAFLSNNPSLDPSLPEQFSQVQPAANSGQYFHPQLSQAASAGQDSQNIYGQSSDELSMPGTSYHQPSHEPSGQTLLQISHQISHNYFQQAAPAYRSPYATDDLSSQPQAITPASIAPQLSIIQYDERNQPPPTTTLDPDSQPIFETNQPNLTEILELAVGHTIVSVPHIRSSPHPGTDARMSPYPEDVPNPSTCNLSVSTESMEPVLINEESVIRDSQAQAGSVSHEATAQIGIATKTPTKREKPKRKYKARVPKADKLNAQEEGEAGGPVKAQSVSVNPKKQSAKAEREAKKSATENALSAAAYIPMPTETTRLASVYENKVGNLVLSSDKSTLEFFSTSQAPPELPIFVLSVSNIDSNPIVSASGSYPMELRVKSKAKRTVVTHCFQFSTTEEARKAADEMRAKVVTARLILSFHAGSEYKGPQEVALEVSKPWKCDKCGSRFRNDIGLKYHVTKSQTICNPNHIPSEVKLRAVKPKKDKVLKRSAHSPEWTPEPRSPRLNQRRKQSQSVEREYYDISDSQDSVVEWAKAVASNGPLNVIKPAHVPTTWDLQPRKSRAFRNLPKEVPLLEEIAIIRPYPDDPNRDVVANGQARRISLPLATDQDFQNITLELIHDNGGLFPADKCTWIAIVGAWLQSRDRSTRRLPESKHCRQALEDLLEANRLLRFSFQFRDRNSRTVTRTFVTVPDFDLNSPEIELLKTQIKNSSPDFYVPPKYVAPEPAFTSLQTVARGTVAPLVLDAESQERQKELKNLEVEKFFERGDSMSSADYEILDDTQIAGVEEDGDMMDLDDFSIEDSKNPNESWHNSSRFKERAAEAMRNRWAVRKSMGITSLKGNISLPGDSTTPGNSTTPAPTPLPRFRKPTLKPLTQDQKEKRAHNAYIRLHAWTPAPAFLPNSGTGAWNEVPTRKKPYKLPYSRKYRLPEPITFLQAPGGAWSERAYGHGVKPIFSRPGRWSGGDRTGETYQRKLGKTFRPVVYPPNSKISKRPRDISETPSWELQQSIEPKDAVETPALKRPRRNSTEYIDAEVDADELSDDFPPQVRISKATGQPVRSYNRKSLTSHRDSEVSFDDDDDDFNLDPVSFRDVKARRSTRASARAREDAIGTEPEFLDLDNVLTLRENPGLKSLPLAFGLKGSELEPTSSSDYSPNYGGIRFVDARVASQGCDLSEGSWVYNGSSLLHSDKFKVKWRRNMAYTMETIPYQELNDDDVLELPKPPRKKQKRVGGTTYSRRDNQNNKYSTIRSQVALAEDFQGVLFDPLQAPTIFGVELGPTPKVMRTRAKETGVATTPEFEQRVLAGCLAVRTLIGGLNELIDWVLLSKVFPEVSQGWLMRHWGLMRSKNPDKVTDIVREFQEAFPTAYEKGEVPSINYNNLLDYDWHCVIDWMIKDIPSMTGKTITLPPSRRELQDNYNIGEFTMDPKTSRDHLFNSKTATYKKFDMAATAPNALSIKGGRNAGEEKIEEFSIAKSWVRASAITPEQDYKKTVAAEKLSDLGLDLVEEALKALVADKCLKHRAKGRATAGRSYEGTENLMKHFKKDITKEQFLEALEHKQFLDATFWSDRKSAVSMEYITNEGAIMCITSLQASGQIRLEDTNVPNNKFGLTDAGYDTRKVNRDKLRFGINIHATESYVFDKDNELLNTIASNPSPQPRDDGALPFWIGITEKLIPDIWEKVIAAVTQTVAMKSGTTMYSLHQMFAPTLESWELRRLMEWGIDVGLFQRLHPRIEGWTVSEGWWLAVGRIYGRM